MISPTPTGAVPTIPGEQELAAMTVRCRRCPQLLSPPFDGNAAIALADHYESQHPGLEHADRAADITDACLHPEPAPVPRERPARPTGELLSSALHVALYWANHPGPLDQATLAARDAELAGCQVVMQQWLDAD